MRPQPTLQLIQQPPRGLRVRLQQHQLLVVPLHEIGCRYIPDCSRGIAGCRSRHSHERDFDRKRRRWEAIRCRSSRFRTVCPYCQCCQSTHGVDCDVRRLDGFSSVDHVVRFVSAHRVSC